MRSPRHIGCHDVRERLIARLNGTQQWTYTDPLTGSHSCPLAMTGAHSRGSCSSPWHRRAHVAAQQLPDALRADAEPLGDLAQSQAREHVGTLGG